MLDKCEKQCGASDEGNVHMLHIYGAAGRDNRHTIHPVDPGMSSPSLHVAAHVVSNTIPGHRGRSLKQRNSLTVVYPCRTLNHRYIIIIIIIIIITIIIVINIIIIYYYYYYCVFLCTFANFAIDLCAVKFARK
jgi:hypothetical protein